MIFLAHAIGLVCCQAHVVSGWVYTLFIKRKWPRLRLVGRVPQRVVVKFEPLLTPVHQAPFSMPAMSALPSPVKSPTITSTQETAVLHCAHIVVLNDEPLEMPVHQEP